GAAGGRRSYDIVLPHELARFESRQTERAYVERGPTVDDELGQELPCGGGVHDAVPRESRGVDEALDRVDLSEDRMLVGRVFVKPRPTCLDGRPFKDRKAPKRALHDRGHEIPVHAVVKRRLLVRVRHSQKNASGLAVCVETCGELDGEGEVLVEPRDGFG